MTKLSSTDPPSENIALKIGGISPNVIRELSGIYPTFVSAFKELISNAYDADATQVSVSFSEDLSSITVEDNGSGMTPFEFQTEYLRIGGSSQYREVDLTPGKRQPIGRKGIGFLAIARYSNQVGIHSHCNQVTEFSTSIVLDRSALLQPITFLTGPFASALAPFAEVQSIHSVTTSLQVCEYQQQGIYVELPPSAQHRLEGQALSIYYIIDFSHVRLAATINYNYLLSLEDSSNLEAIENFCSTQVVPYMESSSESFTRVTIHLREFVRNELQMPRRPGRVRNLASDSGLERFLWDLARSTPVSYTLTNQELKDLGLEKLTHPISPSPFLISVDNLATEVSSLKRPLIGNMPNDELNSPATVKQPIYICEKGLVAQGYLIGFPHPVFPAELRGISVRVRGVEIGKPDFLGVEGDIPVKHRPLLSQVIGEIIVVRGLDAISAIMPGREGFYEDNPQYRALREHLVGNETSGFGVLGQVLRQLWQHHSIESSVARIVQETKQRRQAFLDVAHAVTSLVVSSSYRRALRHLFSRSDICANGLRYAPRCDLQPPEAIGEFKLEPTENIEEDFRIDPDNSIVQVNSQAGIWNWSLFLMGREFNISLHNADPSDPICEIDLSENTIYLNWMHPTRTKMGDAMFVKAALFWRIAYHAADGDLDVMMNLAHHLLSCS